MPETSIVKGAFFKDERGGMRFVNDFDMKAVVRFYEIMPANTDMIRGWQAHREEKKWFYCIQGSFVINLVKIDAFDAPSAALKAVPYRISDDEPQVLFVPGGYATAFKSLQEGSRLQVFSNFDLDTSKNDDFRYPLTQWVANWNI
ncbi:WxcM-like domain-containing protein [Flagellimonas sp.]|uniref:WxcM-like domain-containing protein n=1 Tax=Flagellimonas sp. TaxID=2058762 RepID=UPI003F4A6F7C